MRSRNDLGMTVAQENISKFPLLCLLLVLQVIILVLLELSSFLLSYRNKCSGGFQENGCIKLTVILLQKGIVKKRQMLI